MSRRDGGFTLIEVLIALFVVALGVGALLTTLTSSAESAAYLREKSIAEWIALNRISEVRLGNARPGAGTTSGTVDYAGRSWRWQQTVTDPGIAGILRLDVRVAPQAATTEPAAATAAEDFPALATAYGFLGTAIGPGSGNDPDWSVAAAQPPAAGPGGPGTGAPVPGSGTTAGGTQ